MQSIAYKRCGDYLIPDLALNAKIYPPLGKYGWMRERYLREHRHLLYSAMLLGGTALKAWEKRGTLKEPRYFRTWITRILINTCYDTQRKRRRMVSIEDVPEPQVAAPDISLAMALQSLPEKLRLPLVLYYSEGLTYAEIAQTLRLPMATVRGRIHRAKGQLRKELGAE